MAGFLSSDDPFPISTGTDALFSPSVLGSAVLEPPPTVEQTNSRKRPRSSTTNNNRSISPTANNSNTSVTAGSEDQTYDLVNKLYSKDPNDIVDALNSLLKLSADVEINYALGRHGGMVVSKLVEIFDETIGWKHGDVELGNEDPEDENDDLSDLNPSKETWMCCASPSIVGANELDNCGWSTFCATKLSPTSLNTAMNPVHVLPSNILSDTKDKEHTKRLEIIVMIMRNLSYVQANIRYLSHSAGVIRVLTGALYFRNFKTGKSERGNRDENDLNAENSNNNMCLHAIHALSNLSPFLDISGRKTYIDLFLLDGQQDAAQSQTKAARTADVLVDVKTIINQEKYGKINSLGFIGIYIAKNFSVRDESFAKIPDSAIRPVTKRYIRSALTVFPPLVSLLGLSTSRAVVLSALEFMTVLIDNPDNHAVFLCIPDEVLYHLVRLLYKNRLGRDSLEYLDPVINMVTRVNPMKLLGGYDSLVDCDLRDRSMEFLLKLTALSPELKRRLGKKITCAQTDFYGVNVTSATDQLNTKLYDSILPALTTNVGVVQAPIFAAKLLQNLASVPENRCGITYSQRKIIRAITDPTKSAQISEILLNGVLNKIS